MSNLKTFVKSKTFFIYSILVHFFLSVIIVLVSWQFFEPLAYNFMVDHFTANKVGSKDVVLIAIDDKSLEKHRWPWDRELYGEIFEFLDTYGKPKVIGFDAIVSSLHKEPSDTNFFNSIKNIDNLVVGFSPLLTEYTDKATGEAYSKKFDKKFEINIKDKRKYSLPSTYHSLSKFPVPYFNAVRNVGSINVIPDPDKYLRVADQIVTVNGKNYPSFALRMYLLMNNTKDITLYDNKVVIDKTGLKIPTVTTYNGVQNYIHYYKIYKNTEYSHPKYSAIDVIDSLENIKKGAEPIINPEEFKDKVVFVGMNAKATAQTAQDALSTPVLQKHPGVDIQATLFENLLNNEFIKQNSFWQEVLFLFLIAITTFIVISRTSFFKSLSALIGLGFLYFIFAAVCFYHNYAVSVLTPLAILLVTMIFAYSYQFITEGRNKEKIKHAMGRYLSQDIMKNVVKNIDDIRLGGKKAVVTVLFADIRGFTTMSENMSAEEVSVILNEYFTEIEPIISKYNGVINKFIGDAVMAIFGEPIQDINHAQNAVKCANEMLKKVNQLQGKWINEGKPKIEIGIGINTGEAFVGNIGSEKRLEYTVIGDTVNLASRIESFNKVYKTNFLISSSTYASVSGKADVIKISEVTIRGKSKKMDIYEVLRLS